MILARRPEVERINLEDQDVNGRIILRYMFKKWDWSMDWIDLDQGRESWRVLVNA